MTTSSITTRQPLRLKIYQICVRIRELAQFLNQWFFFYKLHYTNHYYTFVSESVCYISIWFRILHWNYPMKSSPKMTFKVRTHFSYFHVRIRFRIRISFSNIKENGYGCGCGLQNRTGMFVRQNRMTEKLSVYKGTFSWFNYRSPICTCKFMVQFSQFQFHMNPLLASLQWPSNGTTVAHWWFLPAALHLFARQSDGGPLNGSHLAAPLVAQ